MKKHLTIRKTARIIPSAGQKGNETDREQEVRGHSGRSRRHTGMIQRTGHADRLSLLAQTSGSQAGGREPEKQVTVTAVFFPSGRNPDHRANLHGNESLLVQDSEIFGGHGAVCHRGVQCGVRCLVHIQLHSSHVHPLGIGHMRSFQPEGERRSCMGKPRCAEKCHSPPACLFLSSVR